MRVSASEASHRATHEPFEENVGSLVNCLCRFPPRCWRQYYLQLAPVVCRPYRAPDCPTGRRNSTLGPLTFRPVHKFADSRNSLWSREASFVCFSILKTET